MLILPSSVHPVSYTPFNFIPGFLDEATVESMHAAPTGPGERSSDMNTGTGTLRTVGIYMILLFKFAVIIQMLFQITPGGDMRFSIDPLNPEVVWDL